MLAALADADYAARTGARGCALLVIHTVYPRKAPTNLRRCLPSPGASSTVSVRRPLGAVAAYVGQYNGRAYSGLRPVRRSCLYVLGPCSDVTLASIVRTCKKIPSLLRIAEVRHEVSCLDRNGVSSHIGEGLPVPFRVWF